jgi:hypothetical protein
MWRQVVAVGRKLHLWPRSTSCDTIDVWPSAKDVAVADGPHFHFCDGSGVIGVTCGVSWPVDESIASLDLELREPASASNSAKAGSAANEVPTPSQAWYYTI